MESPLVPSAMDKIVAAVDTVTDLMDKVWELAISNPYTTFCLAIGLVGVGVWVFRAIKSAARH